MGYSPFREVGLVYHNARKAFEGYTLFDNIGGDRTFLVNMSGEVVHTWPTPEPSLRTHSSHLLENGNLLAHYVSERSLWPGGSIMAVELDWSGRVVWRHDDVSMHHVVLRLRNGNTLLLRWEWASPDVGARVQAAAGGSREEPVLADVLTEITPKGEVVWEWRAQEKLDPAIDVTCALHGKAKGREWTHINAVCEMPNGDILITCRLTDMLAIIERSTGAVRWRWGRGSLGHPHDATVLENGNLLVFDNGWHFPKTLGWSRVVELDLKGGGSTAAPEIVWTYHGRPKTSFFAAHLGSAQRLPNGNTLICEGPSGRIVEVAGSEIVWEYANPHSFARIHGPADDDAAPWVFRARRYSPESPQLKKARLR